jgi:predicted small integral membrane protein
VITGLLYEVSRTAGAAMVFSGICCLITGMIAFLTNHMPGDPRSAGAFRTSRVMALFGGVCGVVGGLTGMPYHWLAGDISLQTFLAIEAGLVVIAAVWAGVAVRLLHRGGKLHSR